MLSWAVWALLAWFVGSKILGTRDTQADWGQLARGTGFAQTPGILKVLIFIPILGLIIELVADVEAVRRDEQLRSTPGLGLYVDPPSLCGGPHLVCTCGYHKRDSHLGITHRRYSGSPGIGLPRCSNYSLYVVPHAKLSCGHRPQNGARPYYLRKAAATGTPASHSKTDDTTCPHQPRTTRTWNNRPAGNGTGQRPWTRG